tara:strand:+ start:132 stop:698 length:567 start_codon:yes stop_codon:yes gene_type:complete
MENDKRKTISDKLGFWAFLSIEGRLQSDFRGPDRTESKWRVFVAPEEWTPNYVDSSFPGEKRSKQLPGDMKSIYHRSWKKKENYKFERNQIKHDKHKGCLKINKSDDSKKCIIDVSPGAIHFNARYVEDIPTLFLEDENRCIDPDKNLANKLYFENEYMYEKDPRYVRGHDWNCDSTNSQTRGRPEYR